jgi:hypothetical protein
MFQMGVKQGRLFKDNIHWSDLSVRRIYGLYQVTWTLKGLKILHNEEVYNSIVFTHASLMLLGRLSQGG